MGCQKPGFCEILCYGAKIWEKTRFLKIVDGLPETGFLPEYLLRCEDLGKNPVSQDWVGGQKPGFCQNICYGAKIWEKTRFLKIADGLPETGFLRDPLLRCEDLGKNPVSKDWMGCQKPGFCEILCYNPQIREKTRFLLILP